MNQTGTKATQSKSIKAMFQAFLSALGHTEAGGVTEVCAFDGKKVSHVGYFNDTKKATQALDARNGKGNMFVSLNPANPALLGRHDNKLVEGTYKKPVERTKDHEIHRDCWFLVDIDPERPSGISSTNEEKREAFEIAKAVRDWFLSVGVPASAIMTCDSGNGAYVLIRTPDCEVTKEHTERKKAFLNFIADKFDTDKVKVDRTVFNSARLIGALGTLKMKGEDIPERPHRRSAVFTIAGELFDPAKDQRCEPFDLYDLATKIMPTPNTNGAGNNSSTQSKNNKVWFDARLIADKLSNPKPTTRGFTNYDCPNCGHAGKLWIKDDDGKSGCHEPPSVCDWRKLRDKLREIAREIGIDIEAPGTNESRPKVDTDAVLSRIVTAQSIVETEYPDPKWAVKGIIPEGTTIIAGPPKLGKSVFSLNISVAVAEGGKALSHFDVERGAVLYLALEDGERRIKERLRRLTKGRLSDKLEVVTKWPRLNEGGLEAIEEWIKRHSDPRLLMVDTFKRIRPLPRRSKDANLYDEDYDAVVQLTDLTTQYCVALGLVAHTRKAEADDVLAMISGTYGLTGAADGALVLARQRGSRMATMNVIGRDVEEQELALEFDPERFLWSVKGKAEEVGRSDERKKILDLLKQAKEPLTPGEIAEFLDKQKVSTRTLLFKMRDKGEVALFGKKYQLPDYKPPEPSVPTSQKTGNTPKAQKEQGLDDKSPASSVPSVPRAKKTGNASKSQKRKGLDKSVPSVPSVPGNAQNSANEEKAPFLGTLGTLGTLDDKSNYGNGLDAFPVKNGIGNAGNAFEPPTDYQNVYDAIDR